MFGESHSNNSDSREANELDVTLKLDNLSERIKKLGGGKEEYKFEGDKGETVHLSCKDRYSIMTVSNIKKIENGKEIRGKKLTNYDLFFNKGKYYLEYSSTLVGFSGRYEDGGTIKNLSPSEIIGNIIPKFEKRINQAEKKKALDEEIKKQKRREAFYKSGNYALNDGGNLDKQLEEDPANLDKQLEEDLNNLA